MKQISMKQILSMACVVLGCGGGVLAGETAELDVTRVALFSSGVGYFECDATVEGNATSELKFRTEQINDILKSLVVQDFGGGKVGVVSYASRDPIEKALRSFGVDITGKPTLAQLLDQLRGEPVEISGARMLKGVIVGVEKKRTIVGQQVVESDVVNILTPSGLEQLEVVQLGGIRLANEKVDAELRAALATLAMAHDADKKSVQLHFNGAGPRKVRAAYLLEAPIWKTSYRLVLDDAKKPFLQGWATVENATEEDWNNVRLSLVSGRPISFRMDLYTPIYIPRPMEQLELYASLRPPEFEGGFAGDFLARRDEAPAAAAPGAPADKTAGQSLGRSKGAVAGRPGRAGGAGGVEAKKALRDAGDADEPQAGGEVERLGLALTGTGVQSVAVAQEAGELFEYVIQTPVSLQRQHSAMLPIVNDQIEGAKVSIYNPLTHAKHPLNGLELTNTTKLNLMQGPVTLFDADVYAGDAKLPDLKPGEKRLLAYALDLGAEVLVKQQPRPDELVSLRIAKGTLFHKHKYVDTREYEIKNKDDAQKVVILEQPYSEEWKLIEPKEPYERTKNLLRFKVTVPGQKTATQKVQLEYVADQGVVLSELGLDNIRFFLKSPVISPKVKEALEKVVVLRTAVDDAARRRGQLEQQLEETGKQQARVRENIKSLPTDTDAYKRQVKKLDEYETQIEQFQTQIAAARTEEQQKRKALEEYLLTLNVE